MTPVGSHQSRSIEAGVIAATHRNLAEEVRAGRFRADLYYRLKGIMIHLPSLRTRTDLLQLAEHLLRQLPPEGLPGSISKEAQAMLASYSWPGNVRELQGVLIQAAFLADGTTGRNVSQAARLLQIGRNTLYRKMAEYRNSLPVTWEEL